MGDEERFWGHYLVLILLIFFVGCNNDDNAVDAIDDLNYKYITDDPGNTDEGSNTDDVAVFILIDEESIDNGNKPNNFPETDVNDDIFEIGQREELRYFAENVVDTINLYTGQVGDEGWFALTNIPDSWAGVGPMS